MELTIPNKVVDTKAARAINTVDEKPQDMEHIGAAHGGGSTETRRYHPVEMYRELNRLHADAEREQETARQEKTAISPSQATNSNTTTVTHRSARPEDTQEASHMAENHGEDPDSSEITFHKASMARWYTEGPDDQPWSAFRILAEDHASGK